MYRPGGTKQRDSASAPLGDSPRVTRGVNRGPGQLTTTATETPTGKGAGGSVDGDPQVAMQPSCSVYKVTVHRETPATLRLSQESPSTDKTAARGVKFTENGRIQISFAFPFWKKKIMS